MVRTLLRWRILAVLLALLAPATTAGASLPEGARRYAGWPVARVELRGHVHTRDYVIERELRTRPGQPLSLPRLRQDLQRLDNLDIFSSVRAELVPEAAGVVVILRLRELPPAVPYVTYDVTDQDGWSFGPAVKAVNLMGQDIFLAGYALFGGRTSYLVDLTHPWMFGDHVSLDLDASRIVRDNDFDGFRETSTELTPRLGTWLGPHRRASVALSWLRFEADRPGVTLAAGGRDDLFRLGGSLGWDSRDVWANPGRGWWAQVEVWKTGGRLPGDADFWTVDTDVRRFQPLPVDGHTLALAGLLTWQSGRVGRDLPVYLDYHLGGANSLRGYSVDRLGHELFGKNQLLTTLEYRLPLVAPREVRLLGLNGDIGLGAALLVDGGLAWSEDEDLALDRGRLGVGAGLRLLIPAVDMTRVEIAYGADGWHLHVASFSKMRAQRLRLR